MWLYLFEYDCDLILPNYFPETRVQKLTSYLFIEVFVIN